MACEQLFFKLDGQNKDIYEVSIRAKTEEELVKKLQAVKQLEPEKVILNGTCRSFDSVCQVYLDEK